MATDSQTDPDFVSGEFRNRPLRRVAAMAERGKLLANEVSEAKTHYFMNLEQGLTIYDLRSVCNSVF